MRCAPSLLLVLMIGVLATPALCADDPAPLPTFPDASRPAPPPKMVSMIFPVLYNVRWSDTYGAPRDGGRRRHMGQDLMAPKMTPLVAVFDGTVYFYTGHGTAGNHIYLHSDDGWTAVYVHVNNDTPGTNDGAGGDFYAFAAGLRSGDRVRAGQLIGYVGNSGNAETTAPHLHFELQYQRQHINPHLSLRKARRIKEPVVNLPFPEMRPEPGEMRLDGSVLSIQGDRIVLNLAAETRPGKKAVPIVRPTRRYVLLKDVRVQIPGAEAYEPTLADITPGTPVTVLGKDRGKDRALLARVVAPGLTERQIALRLAARNSVAQNDASPNPMPVDMEPEQGAEAPMEISAQDTPAKPPVAQEGLSPLPEDPQAIEVIREINALRRQRGLSELVRNDLLTRAALRHTRDMASGAFCEHVGSDGSRPWDRVQDTGHPAERVAENIASGFQTPRSVVQAWMNQSVESRRNLMDPNFTEIGVAHYRGYWTVMLAGR
ncbi:MAG: peptidoglycan DD-metalloendopeptidase family protein [Chloroherpetonaceae bacterium]|nr:peptidoglycan DD-metalloendopeptidase family protein [Chthonomonadaceae bacterium]MDW8208001.1 peptidoglycan DD-metalloendopeptidase family protein [Chloroherpetonaceae bacterium]